MFSTDQSLASRYFYFYLFFFVPTRALQPPADERNLPKTTSKVTEERKFPESRTNIPETEHAAPQGPSRTDCASRQRELRAAPASAGMEEAKCTRKPEHASHSQARGEASWRDAGEGTIASAPGAGVAEAVLASDRSWILRVQGRRKEPRTGQSVCAFPRHIQHPKPLLGCTADPTRAPYLLTSAPGLCAPAPSAPSSQIPAFPSQDWDVFLRTCPSPRFLSPTACSSLRNDHRGLSTSQQLLEANGAARAPAPALLLPWDGARRRGEQLGRGGLSSRFSLSPPRGKASD